MVLFHFHAEPNEKTQEIFGQWKKKGGDKSGESAQHGSSTDLSEERDDDDRMGL